MPSNFYGCSRHETYGSKDCFKIAKQRCMDIAQELLTAPDCFLSAKLKTPISFCSCQAIFTDVLGTERKEAMIVPQLLNLEEK